MHRRSSGSPVEDDAEDSLVSRAPTEESYGFNSIETPEKSRPQLARTGTSFDIRRDVGNSTPRSRNSSTWRTPPSQASPDTTVPSMMPLTSQRLPMEASPDGPRLRHHRLRSPWLCSILTAVTTSLALIFLLSILRSFSARQVGSDGCGIPVMSPTFIRMLGFDTEHTRFASKYNLYLYREEGVDPYNQENIGVSSLGVLDVTGLIFLVEWGSCAVLARECWEL